MSIYEVLFADSTYQQYLSKNDINDFHHRRMFNVMEQYNESEIEMEDDCTLRINTFSYGEE